MAKIQFVAVVVGFLTLMFGSAVSAETKGKAPVNGSKLETAYFAMGCFWKTQYVFGKVPGVVETKVGYTGGKTDNPNYQQVCTDKSGHAEAVKVVFDPAKVSYKRLLEVFWSSHDPTTRNRQGPDIGTQYRSAVFYASPEQQQEASALKTELDKSGKFRSAIVTEIVPAATFHNAEEYHQNYFIKHGAACN